MCAASKWAMREVDISSSFIQMHSLETNAVCRCLRIRKDCQPSESARRRNAQKSQGQESDARIAQLEGKVDTLMSVLQATVGTSGTPVDLNRLLNTEQNIPTSSTSGSSHSTTGSTNPNTTSQGPTPTTEPFPTAPIHSDPSSDISPLQAEESLNFFRTRMLPHFPFLHLPPDQTAWQLRIDRPILFQAILTVTTLSTQRKLLQAEHFKRLIFTSALIEAQSNIDLLLGIVTYIAWSTDAFLGRANLLSRLMMLAISLVYDLRLFKPSSPDVQLIVRLTQGYSESELETRASGGGTLESFLEQQRAVLACFVLSSKYATKSIS